MNAAAVQQFFWLFLFNSVTALLAIVDFNKFTKCPQPKWSSSYYVEGDIISVMAEMHEPFNAWYDSESRKSRIDYHHGNTMTYQLSNKRSFDSSIKIVQFTTEKETSDFKCIEVNGTNAFNMSPQKSLPDLSNYKLIDQNLGNDSVVEKWRYTKTVQNTFFEYIMLLYREECTIIYPMKFQMNAFNSLFQRVVDNYTIVYKHYKPVKHDPDTFYSEEVKCEYSSVPGVNDYYAINPMMEFINNSTEYVSSVFEEFKKQHNKSYTIGTFEHFKREINFRRNLRYIHSKNRAISSFTLALNHFADYSNTELKSIFGYTPVNDEKNNGGNPFPYNMTNLQFLPPEIDWRYTGAVTPVKDESICHACWSFSATGTAEGSYFMRHGKSKRFSEQALIDCGPGKNGRITNAYSWMKWYGLPTDEYYSSHFGQDSLCHIINIPNEHLTKITSFVNVTPFDEDALKVAVALEGPISIIIDASPKTFAFYSHGIYSDKDCRKSQLDVNHAVLLVGYSSFNGYPYWLVKNSWSARWGIGGYILISRFENNCGVLTSPTYVIL